jgi:virginiamycin B lyase
LSVAINEFPVPTAGSDPTDIVTGPDGNPWFTEFNSNKIVQINPTTHAIAEFPIPTADSNPSEITTGPDSSLYMN